MFLEQQISILQWFLKDRVTLKTHQVTQHYYELYNLRIDQSVVLPVTDVRATLRAFLLFFSDVCSFWNTNTWCSVHPCNRLAALHTSSVTHLNDRSVQETVPTSLPGLCGRCGCSGRCFSCLFESVFHIVWEQNTPHVQVSLPLKSHTNTH